MMKSLDYHVFEDKAVLDAASPVAVREHFRQWVQSAPQRERRPSSNALSTVQLLHPRRRRGFAVYHLWTASTSRCTGYRLCEPDLSGNSRGRSSRIRDRQYGARSLLDACLLSGSHADLVQPLSYARHVVHRVSGAASNCESLNGLRVAHP